MLQQKQTCYICSDEVTESDYRRELSCSYVGCPGSDQAYHEECINEYLRKLKLPADRLIGYPCPATLDNGRPCTGRITSTHHRQPLNQKKKQKRVEAAAAAAAVPKAKQQPVAKAKEPKQVNGVAAATAAMRPAGEAVLRQAGVSMNSVKTVNVKAASKVVMPGSAAAARLTGTGSAISNNAAMAPERVVRQHVIPGMSPGDKLTSMSTLEHQRAMIQALRAKAKEDARSGNKAKAAANAAAGAGSGRAGAGAAPGGQAAGSRKPGTGQPVRRQLVVQEEGDDESGSDDSDVHPFSRYLREEVSSDSFEEPTAAQPPAFQLAQEDFPAFPTLAPQPSSGSAAPTPSKQQRAATPPTPPAAREPQPQQPASAASSAGGMGAEALTPKAGTAAAAGESASPASPAGCDATPADEEEDPDPVVAHDPVYAAEDGTAVLVQDAYGNYLRVEDVYGPEPEYIGLQDDQGNVTYYVVIRQSTLMAAQAAAEQQQQQLEGQTTLTPEDSLGGGGGNMDFATAAPAVAPHDGFGAAPATSSQASARSHLQAQGQAAQAVPAAAAAQQHPTPTAAVPVPVAGVEEGDLDDLLALCMGGEPAAGAATAAPAPQASAPVGFASYAGYTDPYSHAAAYPSAMSVAAQPEYAMEGPVGYSVQGYAVAPAPAGAAAQPAEGEELSDLMQLLCV